MDKDFKKWNELKTYIEENNKPLLFHEREIWWCSIGLNIGREQDGKTEYFHRPVLILRKFNKDIFLGLPMSTKTKNDRFHYTYSFDNNLNSSFLLSQLRLLSSKRLIRRIITINENTFNEIALATNDLIYKKLGPLSGSSGA